MLGGSDYWGLRGWFDGLKSLWGRSWPTAADPDTIPVLVFAPFQLMFAIITPALISGAIADRAKFARGWCSSTVWITVVYFPVAHWVCFGGPRTAGSAASCKRVDFAGGTAVHINAGAAGLALAHRAG